MEPNKNDESAEPETQVQQQSPEEMTRAKLRDLKPEKDPIGAGGTDASELPAAPSAP